MAESNKYRLLKTSRKQKKGKKVNLFLKVLVICIFVAAAVPLMRYMLPFFVPFTISEPGYEKTMKTGSFKLRDELLLIRNEGGFDEFVSDSRINLIHILQQILQNNQDKSTDSNSLKQDRQLCTSITWELLSTMEPVLYSPVERCLFKRNQETEETLLSVCLFASRQIQNYQDTSDFRNLQNAVDLLLLAAGVNLRTDMPSPKVFQACSGGIMALAEQHSLPNTEWEKIAARVESLIKEHFPQKRFIFAQRKKILDLYEQIRIRGISSFRIHQDVSGQLMKQRSISKKGFLQTLKDFFYDIDADELSALKGLRCLLTNEFISRKEFPASAFVSVPHSHAAAHTVFDSIRESIFTISDSYADLYNFVYAVHLLDNKSIPTEITNPFCEKQIKFIREENAIMWDNFKIMILYETDK